MHRFLEKPRLVRRSMPVSIAEPSSALPEWVIAPILAGLVGISGLIALVGWLIAKPVPPTVAVQEIIVQIPARMTAIRLQGTSGYSEDAWSEPYDRPLPEVALLPRRVQPRWADVAPLTEDAGRDFSTASDSNSGRAPIRWVMEPLPAGLPNLMMPIEMAKIEDGVLPYRLRRLQLAEDQPKRLRLAITPVAHDDVGSVLRKMGAGYRATTMRRQDLMSLESLKKHDVVFLTCADLYANDFLAALPLRKFVEQGGTLYASDLCGDLVLAAFPEFRAPAPCLPGVPQSIDAGVVDPGLRSHLGRKSISLNFDAPDWRPAAFDPSMVTVCLRGVYRNNFGQAVSAPLMVQFRVGQGTVIFTSFHHTKNDSALVQKLLDYLVFASVNARSEARVRDLMQRSRFAPQDLRPIALTTGKVTHATHEHQVGDLQIALGFENLGAKLKLTLRSPSGRIVEHEDQGLYLIEIPAAEPGLWRYTVTPVELPYANFPILVAVGTAKS